MCAQVVELSHLDMFILLPDIKGGIDSLLKVYGEEINYIQTDVHYTA